MQKHLLGGAMRCFDRAQAEGSFEVWFPRLRDRILLERRLQRFYEGRQSSWAYIWWMICWSHSMLAINPAVNLVRNTSFGAGDTHTPDPDHWMAHLPVGELAFPLRHPECVASLPAVDDYFCNVRGKAGLKRTLATQLSAWFAVKQAKPSGLHACSL